MRPEVHMRATIIRIGTFRPNCTVSTRPPKNISARRTPIFDTARNGFATDPASMTLWRRGQLRCSFASVRHVQNSFQLFRENFMRQFWVLSVPPSVHPELVDR